MAFGWDDAAAGIVKLGGGFAGQVASQGDRVAASKDRLQALHQWININVPDPEQQKLILDRYMQTGELHPEIEQAISQGPSALNNVQTDPKAKEAQLRALSSLENIGLSGGLTDQDKADYARLEADLNANDKGRRGAIESKFARQGKLGSGLSLAAQLGSAQDTTNRLALGSMDKMASAKQRALDAFLKGGQLAGDIRGQDYSQARDLAGAEDAISRFNTANKMSVQERNTAALNNAKKYNLGMKQDIANKNTELGNKEQQYNKELLQKQFDNRSTIAAGASGQYNKNAAASDAAANRTAGQWAGAGDAIGKGIDSYGQREREQDRYDDFMNRAYPRPVEKQNYVDFDDENQKYFSSLV